MKSFAEAVTKIDKNLIDAFEKAADAAAKGTADAEQHWHNLEKTCKDTGSASIDAAYEEIRKHLTSFWMEAGLTKAEAETRFAAKLKHVKELAEKTQTVQTYAPKLEAAAKYGWLKFVGGVTAIFATAMVYMSFSNSGPSSEMKGALDTLRHNETQQERLEQLNEIVVSEEEFNIMIGGLEVPSAPKPIEPATAAAAAPALPATIAAAAAMPVAVEVRTQSGTRTFETNIEHVYRNSPPAVRGHLESTVSSPPPKITHGYDGPGITEDPDSCFVRHCMSGGDGGGRHKTFTVAGTPFGSATFSY